MAKRALHVNGVDYEIGYEILHPEQAQTIVFLHGWGANKEIMKKAFGGVFKEYQHLYIDLPGFGASSLHVPLVSLEYAAVVRAFLEALHVTPEIMVGHSFGGKVATLLNPSTLVLLSSAGIVPPKPLGVRVKIALFKFLKRLGFGRFYRLFATKDVQGMAPVMYETLKKVVNEDMREVFAAYKGRALVCWGEEDKTTPLQSGEEIARLIPNATFYPLQGDHFFFILHGARIERALKEA
ncbi:alpha/beta hydrolase [Sulfurospirillum sp. T05]|uniref:Alpha/beta hydrolase n=1 Tax=Sulfurospirillum tamanense TaxID=2813362 RepID=A0ABS2WR82_9BACT|nr:alpha/beta hydrolase [Sulfurospirillum tamanensis]MBN2964123.1 alpha/beta hydrolase [Sulfurospirillum tamanensis]